MALQGNAGIEDINVWPEKKKLRFSAKLWGAT